MKRTGWQRLLRPALVLSDISTPDISHVVTS